MNISLYFLSPNKIQVRYLWVAMTVQKMLNDIVHDCDFAGTRAGLGMPLKVGLERMQWDYLDAEVLFKIPAINSWKLLDSDRVTVHFMVVHCH